MRYLKKINQIKFKIYIKLTSIIKFSYFIFPCILSSVGKIWERKNFMNISFNEPCLIGIIKQIMVLLNRLQECEEMFLKVIFGEYFR